MSEELAAILAKHHNAPIRLVDMLHDLQLLDGQISEAAIEQTMSFSISARPGHMLVKASAKLFLLRHDIHHDRFVINITKAS